MNISLCTDENFIMPALVCITSIFENNKGEHFSVYILTDGISEKAELKFLRLADIYKQEIFIKTIDKRCFDGLTVNERFPVSMYYRFLLPDMLQKEEKVLYLDCDIIVRHSLKPLYDIDLYGKAIAAVVAESCDDIVFENTLLLEGKYFNSGVLLLNLEYWRKNDIAKKLIGWVADNPDKCSLPDQNALNKILDGSVVYADYTYNFQEWWFRDSLVSYMHYSKWNEIRECGKDPVVVHFCEAEKPWFAECKNPYQNEFLHYANLHDFIGFKLQKRYGFTYQCANFVDRIGLKFRYWAERWQKNIVKNIKIS